MDQYVKRRALGFDKVAPVQVIVDDATYRTGTTWPPAEAVDAPLDASGLIGDIVLVGRGAPAAPVALAAQVAPIDVAQDTALAGVAKLQVTGALLPAGNAFFYATLVDATDDGSAIISYGALNLALRGGYDKYAPSAPGETTSFELPFLPTEHVFRAGHRIELSLWGVGAQDLAPESTSQPGVYRVKAATLVLPTIDASQYVAAPATATR
jgi:hypothetical protein